MSNPQPVFSKRFFLRGIWRRGIWGTLALLGGALVLAGQEQHPQQTGKPAEHKETVEEEVKEWGEAEFVASDIFRSGTLVLPIWRKLEFEGHYFGGEHTDVGYTGLAWAFRWRNLLLAPGVGAAFGAGLNAYPAVGLRWSFKKGWFLTQGMTLQGLREVRFENEPGVHSSGHAERTAVRALITDGSHISARIKRVTVGGTWEHIEFREGSEWKGGGRFQFRFLPRASAVLYVLGPGKAEFRFGILLHGTEWN